MPRLRATPAVINCWSINKFLQQQRNTMTQMNTEKPDFFFRCASFARHQQKEQHDFVIFFSLLLLYAAGNRRSERSAAGKINRCVQCSFMFLSHIMHTTKPTPKMEKNRADFLRWDKGRFSENAPHSFDAKQPNFPFFSTIFCFGYKFRHYK